MSVLCDLEDFFLQYNGEKGLIGKSYLDRPLYYFKVEKTTFPKIIVQYAIHAREYITTYLALEQIKEFEKTGNCGTVYFMPALNPDGIVISQFENPLYKANARGVDLNVNFDARWGSGEFNLREKGSENYIGEYPFSEPETRALKYFTLKIEPNATISYHSKGEEIYYEFFQKGKRLKRDKRLAKKLAIETGYAVKSTPFSAGGYKDWCVEKLKIPAFTIEVGSDNLSHPIDKRFLEEIFIKNRRVINVITENISGT
jgi:g-D-glutamyl-meso-diaminopimelate peptidase